MKNVIELVTIGSELLNGRTLNTHAKNLGAALSARGWQLGRDTTVADVPSTMQAAVTEALARVDVVIASGGLGPTADDMTRDVLGELFGRRVVMSPEALADLHERFAAKGREVLPAAERMAQILEGSQVLLNPVGAAAAMRLDLPEGKSLFIVPGPPLEFAGVLEAHVLPWLMESFGARDVRLKTSMWLEGIGEALLTTMFEAEGLPLPGVDAGYYPGSGRVEIILTAEPNERAVLDETADRMRALVLEFVVSA